MEVEALAARQDCLRDLLRVGRAQHEHHVRRRLLERLEQRVERRRGEHVDLVDDVNLVRAAHRGEAHRVDDLLAHVVHTRTGCGVQLVDVRMRALGDGLALGAVAVWHAAGGAVRARSGGMLAQQRLGQDACHGGLTCAARPAEQVGVREAPLGDGMLQRRHDVLLAHHAVKRERAILPVQRLHEAPLQTTSICQQHKKENSTHTRKDAIHCNTEPRGATGGTFPIKRIGAHAMLP